MSHPPKSVVEEVAEIFGVPSETLRTMFEKRADASAAQPSDKSLAPVLERRLLTVDEAADSLGVGRTTMYALIRAGRVRSVRVGRARRVSTASLDAFVASLTDGP